MRPAVAAQNAPWINRCTESRVGRFEEDECMNIEYLLTGLVALAIGIYLVVALLRPDKF
jgi:K+-transporting ATPase KdpF subunit